MIFYEVLLIKTRVEKAMKNILKMTHFCPFPIKSLSSYSLLIKDTTKTNLD